MLMHKRTTSVTKTSYFKTKLKFLQAKKQMKELRKKNIKISNNNNRSLPRHVNKSIFINWQTEISVIDLGKNPCR
jgi:hypothetical protein